MNVLAIKRYFLWLWESIDLVNCIQHPIYMSWLWIGIWHSYIISIIPNLNMSCFYIKCDPSRSMHMTYIRLSIYIMNIYIAYLPNFNIYPNLLTLQQQIIHHSCVMINHANNYMVDWDCYSTFQLLPWQAMWHNMYYISFTTKAKVIDLIAMLAR